MGKWERGCGGAAVGCDLLGDWHASLGLFLFPFNILQHRTKTSPREWPRKVARSNAFPISAPLLLFQNLAPILRELCVSLSFSLLKPTCQNQALRGRAARDRERPCTWELCSQRWERCLSHGKVQGRSQKKCGFCARNHGAHTDGSGPSQHRGCWRHGAAGAGSRWGFGAPDSPGRCKGNHWGPLL